MVALLVLLTFVSFLLAEIILQTLEARKAAAVTAGSAVRGFFDVGPEPALALAAAAPPPGLFVARGHAWLGLDPSGSARIGADDFIGQTLGRIDRVELPEVGKTVRRGEPLFTLCQGDRSATLTAPVDGIVTAINADVERDAALVKADPYARGWVCTVKPAGIAAALHRLLLAEEAQAWIASEIERFRTFLTGGRVTMALGTVSPDGGQVLQGALEHVDDTTWNVFVEEFLAQTERA